MTHTSVSAGRRADFEAVYRQHGRRMWRAVMAYAGDAAVADDAVAEAFAQGLSSGSLIRSPERWVWRAAFRIAAGMLKERGRFAPPVSTPVARDAEPEWELIGALAELPVKQRACVVLHYYGGYPTIEVARIVGSTPVAVRQQISRGRKRLGLLLEGGVNNA
jgi:RNA polymerase sigma factor (sigma-70 family)